MLQVRTRQALRLSFFCEVDKLCGINLINTHPTETWVALGDWRVICASNGVELNGGRTQNNRATVFFMTRRVNVSYVWQDQVSGSAKIIGCSKDILNGRDILMTSSLFYVLDC